MSLLTYNNGEVTVSPEVALIRDRSLERAALIHSISSEKEKDDAHEVLMVLKTYLTWIDKIRVDEKAPYLKACKAIDAKAKELCSEMNHQLYRLKEMASDYIQKQEAVQLEEIKEHGGVISSASIGEGISSQDSWEFEVEDPVKALTMNPELFELVPKRAEIKKLLREGVTIPGIKAWKEKSVRIETKL